VTIANGTGLYCFRRKGIRPTALGTNATRSGLKSVRCQVQGLYLSSGIDGDPDACPTTGIR